MAKSIVNTTVAFKKSEAVTSDIWYIVLGNKIHVLDIVTGMIEVEDAVTFTEGEYTIEEVTIKWDGNHTSPAEVVFVIDTTFTFYMGDVWNIGTLPKERKCEDCIRAALCPHIGGCFFGF